MKMLDFLKDAGAHVLGAVPGADAATKLVQHVKQSGVMDGVLEGDVKVEYDAAAGEVKVSGAAVSQEQKEKIVLALGNVRGVGKVVDTLAVKEPSGESRMYTVKGGDSLSKIAKAMYGDAAAYGKIFEANKPLLKDVDKIYPGQVLRIPA